MEAKIYLFISHSHKDLEKVRIIRNYIESLNAEPILFFLKSLSDADKITKLIEDEIDARIWFIYCKSPNAEESEWVRTEIEYATSTGKTYLLSIDLEKDFENGDLNDKTKATLRDTFHIIRRNTTFFVSCAHSDTKTVKDILSYLNQFGFGFYYDEDIHTVDNWGDTSKKMMETSPFFLWFVSEDSISSNAVDWELRIANDLKKEILPVVLMSGTEGSRFPTISDKLSRKAQVLDRFQYFPFDTSDIRSSANKLIHYIIKTYNL